MSDEANMPAVMPKPRKISRRVRRAIELMVNGTEKTVTGAAKHVGLSREALSRALARPHIVKFVHERTARILAIAAGRAGAVKVELLESDNSRVRNEASTFLLSLAGIRPTEETRVVSVNVEIKAGYVIDLREPEERMRDATPAPAQPRVIEPASAAPQIHKLDVEDGDAE